jgi:hypothetical protein
VRHGLHAVTEVASERPENLQSVMQKGFCNSIEGRVDIDRYETDIGSNFFNCLSLNSGGHAAGSGSRRHADRL